MFAVTKFLIQITPPPRGGASVSIRFLMPMCQRTIANFLITRVASFGQMTSRFSHPINACSPSPLVHLRMLFEKYVLFHTIFIFKKRNSGTLETSESNVSMKCFVFYFSFSPKLIHSYHSRNCYNACMENARHSPHFPRVHRLTVKLSL